MTKDTLEKALSSLRNEVRESVVSYFAPVRAVVRDVSKSIESATHHVDSIDRTAGGATQKGGCY